MAKHFFPLYMILKISHFVIKKGNVTHFNIRFIFPLYMNKRICGEFIGGKLRGFCNRPPQILLQTLLEFCI